MNDTLQIFVDSDAFVALAVKNDANHEKAFPLLHLLQEKQVIFFTSNYVFSESITVISQRESHAAAVTFIENMQLPDSPFQIKRVDEALEEEAILRFKVQTSKNTSYVDCTNISLMKKLDLDAIFSFDKVYRKSGFPLVEDLLEEKAA